MHRGLLLTLFIIQEALANYPYFYDPLYHHCLGHNERSFFYTYEKLEAGCTLNCYWLDNSLHEEYFEKTIHHSFNMDGSECLDSSHVCKDGKCQLKPTASTLVTTETPFNSTSGRTLLSRTTRAPVTEVTLFKKYGIVKVAFYAGYFNVMDGKSKGDPYIITRLNGAEIHKTQIIKNSHRVKFNQSFDLGVFCTFDDKLKFEVWDSDKLLDDRIGSVEFSLEQILNQNKNGKILTYTWPNQNWLEFSVTWTNSN